jgi:hypothetical protein
MLAFIYANMYYEAIWRFLQKSGHFFIIYGTMPFTDVYKCCFYQGLKCCVKYHKLHLGT